MDGHRAWRLDRNVTGLQEDVSESQGGAPLREIFLERCNVLLGRVKKYAPRLRAEVAFH